MPLREVWKHEALDFTTWLRENIDVFNEALNLSLAKSERERAAGDFSVDLVAEDESGDPVRTLTTARGGPRLAAPKTKGSRRRVSLTKGAVDALRAHLARQLEEIDRAGSLWQENGLVFASETGEPLDRRDLSSRQFKPLLKRAKLPEKTRFHDLRHTCATLRLTKNVNPKIVSEMLGHATIAITLDTYSHVLPTMQESAAKAMEEILS